MTDNGTPCALSCLRPSHYTHAVTGVFFRSLASAYRDENYCERITRLLYDDGRENYVSEIILFFDKWRIIDDKMEYQHIYEISHVSFFYITLLT